MAGNVGTFVAVVAVVAVVVVVVVVVAAVAVVAIWSEGGTFKVSMPFIVRGFFFQCNIRYTIFE